MRRSKPVTLTVSHKDQTELKLLNGCRLLPEGEATDEAHRGSGWLAMITRAGRIGRLLLQRSPYTLKWIAEGSKEFLLGLIARHYDITDAFIDAAEPILR